METSEEDRKMNLHLEDQEQELPHKKKGGFITLPFIIANESFEKVASYGLTPNMIIYLMKDYKMSVTKAQNLLYFWNAASNFLPIVGAFVADSFLGRFLTIAFASLFSLLGTIILWMTTVIPQTKPPPCNPLANNCKSPTSGQYTLLIFAFILMSIGAGGVRPCSQAFGADQVDQRDNPKKKRILETFFNWYYACACLSVVIALTVIVYIQDHLGWRIGFGIPVILMFLSALSFFLASRLYVMIEVKKSLFTTLAQVISAAFKNRKMDVLSARGSSVQYYQGKDSVASLPSDRLRFLNKACIIQDPNQDIGPDGMARNPWRLCTVEDVEGLKSLIRIIPIWSSGIMMSVNTGVGSFPVLLAQTMDRHLGSKFEIPAASFGIFLVLVIVIWIPVYDRVLLPIASKICGKPVSLSVKLRMGIGLFFSFLSVLVAGIVESIRRHRAISEGFGNNPQAVIHMSAMWTVPQYVFGGLAEAFNAIGQTEFYYSELPKNMSSIATSLSGLGMAFGSLIASLILNLTDGITKSQGKEGWIASNVNQGHYDYYYWLLAILSFLNIIYYMYCSWAYGPVMVQRKKVVQREVKDDELAMLRNTSRHEKGELKQDYSFSKSNELQR